MDKNQNPVTASPALTAPVADARSQFLATVDALRPRLHQFCTRMTGSVFDGEDMVQDTLAEAFFRLGGLRDERRLAPWLFRIAHNKCIDFLRRHRESTGLQAEEEIDMAATPEQELEADNAMTDALAAVIVRLPPKERACIVLKDVLGHSLEEIAEIADSTVGGVKSALHRARTRLARSKRDEPPAALAAEELRLLEAYVRCFNAHDWEGASRLLSADARLELVGFIDARGADFITSTYYRNYAAMERPWRFEIWEVDGTPVAVMLRETDGAWQPHAGFCAQWDNGTITHIRDYIHVPYLYAAALRQRRLVAF